MQGAISRLAPNATAFPHRSARMNLQYNVALDKVGEAQAALAWQRQTVSRVRPLRKLRMAFRTKLL